MFDHYQGRCRSGGARDTVQWHYHPLPVTGNFHGSGVAYLTSNNIWEILARKVIERQWFPSAYKPGFHTERPDSHWFLEQWIPFDYGNQAVRSEKIDQPDLADGRYGDWRRAPAEWIPYHPGHDDYQKKGDCRRWIARCLNMEARLREIGLDDVRDAFLEPERSGRSLLAFTNHDFRDMAPEIVKVREMLRVVAGEFPEVGFEFTDAVTGIREVTGVPRAVPELECSLSIGSGLTARLDVLAGGEVFGSQPFLAMKLIGDRFIWENLDQQGENSWSFTFDGNHIPYRWIEEIGVACNSPDGCTEIVNIDRKPHRSRIHEGGTAPSDGS